MFSHSRCARMSFASIRCCCDALASPGFTLFSTVLTLYLGLPTEISREGFVACFSFFFFCEDDKAETAEHIPVLMHPRHDSSMWGHIRSRLQRRSTANVINDVQLCVNFCISERMSEGKLFSDVKIWGGTESALKTKTRQQMHLTMWEARCLDLDSTLDLVFAK